MKYKNDYLSRLEASVNMVETLKDALENNKPYTREELAQITRQLEKTLKFILERFELESE